jgi:hypothetical protein
MKLPGLGAAALLGGLCAAMAVPAAATVVPTLSEHDGFYTVNNPSPFYVNTIFATNPEATKSDLDSTTQSHWQAGYCVGGCLGGLAFFFDAEAFSDEIGPGQSSSLFFFTPPASSGSYRLLLSNADDSDAGYISGITAPKPVSWALMIMGIASVGAVLRRRSNQVSPARIVPGR